MWPKHKEANADIQKTLDDAAAEVHRATAGSNKG
jgi:hypothetical protein